MHPTTATYLASSHTRDLDAEVAHDGLAKSARLRPADVERAPNWGLRLRRVIPLLRGKAAGAATA